MKLLFFTAVTLFSPMMSYAQDGAMSLCDGLSGDSQRVCRMRESARSGNPDCSLGEYWLSMEIKDEMTDAKSCLVIPAPELRMSDGLHIRIKPKDSLVSVGGSKYPGTSQKIRVDSNPAVTITGSAGGRAAEKIIKQLRHGSVVRTQFVEWPYNANITETIPVCDLPAKIDACAGRLK